MRLVVDPWDPSYGSAAEAGALADTIAEVNLGVECPADEWAPRVPPAGVVLPDTVVFVDGVRRVDARVWVGADAGAPDEPGLCASWAAGAVRCDGEARLAAVRVGRGLFAASGHVRDLVTEHGVYGARMASGPAPEVLSLALQERMLSEELVVAELARDDPDELLVVDGPLRGRQHLPNAVGLVKTHHVQYLTGRTAAVLAALEPGERTPAFTIGTGRFTRHSWYVRLPGATRGAPLAGVVRCECSADLGPSALVELASVTAALLPRFASAPHKDARAPQNLYPIAGLERDLRRRLGDARLLYRALRAAAA